MKALIISDGKPGHFNQSVALCKNRARLRNLGSELRQKISKKRSHIFSINSGFIPRNCYAISLSRAKNSTLLFRQVRTTYYANKLLAKKWKIPNIAILYPKSYRLDFSHIFCPAYDNPPKQENITEIPLNLCAADSAFFVEKSE